MIIDSFDLSEAIVSPASFFGEQKHVCKTAIATFSREIFASVIEKYPHELITQLGSVNKIRPVYLVDVDGVKFAFYLSEMGSAQSATDVIEINWQTGAEKFILFGSCGALDNEKTAGRYIIPTEAYRDEGMSYHYAPPADYIVSKSTDILISRAECGRLTLCTARQGRTSGSAKRMAASLLRWSLQEFRRCVISTDLSSTISS